MNEYLNSVQLLNDWWDSLDEEWKSFICLNYYYANQKRDFFIINESIFNGDFIDDFYWRKEILPLYIHYAFSATKFPLEFDSEFISKDGLHSHHFEIYSIAHASNFHNLEELQVSSFIKDFSVSILKNLTNLKTLKVDQAFIRQIPEILILNLPSLKKITVEMSSNYNRNDYEFFKSLINKTWIEIAEVYSEDCPKIII